VRVAILGTGLIGGSIALGLRGRRVIDEVVGYDRDPGARRAAAEALTRGVDRPEEAVAGADLVVLATPVDQMVSLCARLTGRVPDGAAVTDVGSAKVEAVAAGEGAFGPRFIGGHPMAGSERHGFGAADGRLFEGAPWILTPTPATSSESYSKVADLVARLGAKPVAVPPGVHDALVARLSHVPQLTASALVDVAAGAQERDALLGLAAGGFRDVTRIAASNPELWVAILQANRKAVLEALDGLRSRLGEIGEMIASDRWDELLGWLSSARRARIELFAKPDYGGDPVALNLMVPDRPGVLAEVTTAAGELGANLEDIEIFHSTEGGGGRLELVVAGADHAGRLAEALTRLGYVVEQGVID
jgi:prephenate dehydrogenase